MEEKMKIPLTTGNIDGNHEIIDTIFALDGHEDKFLTSVDPNKVFEGVKQKLRMTCQELGGDAVMGCRFEYRNALIDGFIGKKHAVEIFAYGTAIKYKQDKTA